MISIGLRPLLAREDSGGPFDFCVIVVAVLVVAICRCWFVVLELAYPFSFVLVSGGFTWSADAPCRSFFSPTTRRPVHPLYLVTFYHSICFQTTDIEIGVVLYRYPSGCLLYLSLHEN